MRQLQPHTPAEREVVEEVVAAEWRLRRCQEAEAELLNAQMESGAHPTAGMAFQHLADNSGALQLLLRYMTAAERSFDRALKRYHEVVKRRRAEQDYDRINDPLTPKGYKNKWGQHPETRLVSYCGRHADVLPNEPDCPGILTAAIESLKPPAMPPSSEFATEPA